MFELKIIVRDGNGNPKGYKTYETNDANDLASWYERNAWRDMSKRTKSKSNSGKQNEQSTTK